MDKNSMIFVLMCIIAIASVLGVYSYNRNKYETQSTLVVVPMEDTSSSGIEYVVSRVETTTSLPIVTTISDFSTITDITTTPIIITTTELITTELTTTTTTTQTDTQKVVNFPISLNSITYDELICINGIGDVTAQKILNYRSSIGGYFTSRYQLLEISGIGEKKMNTIMEYTYIENENLDYGQEVVTEVPVYEPPQDVQAQAVENPMFGEETYYQEPIQEVVQFPVNLNTATFEQLCAIPNVDESIANEILSLRDTIQYFSNPYELLYVDTISESFLSEIIDYVCVE